MQKYLNKFLICLLLCYCAFNWYLVPEASSYENPDFIFPASRLGTATIHMLKILPTKTGSAPLVELRFDKKYQWLPCGVHSSNNGSGNWGHTSSSYIYKEDMVEGSHVALGNYNHIYDVSYYKCVSHHPCGVPIYEKGDEKKKMERFIFFKFTATAAKGSRFFEKKLDNFMVALDINTKLLFSYGAPSDYESIIGGNYVPLKWLAYETHPNTKASFLKFYQYDPIGYVTESWTVDTETGLKTNVVFYGWWKDSIKAGNSYKTVKAKRFMPRLEQSANTNYFLRNPNTPVASPYRDGMQL